MTITITIADTIILNRAAFGSVFASSLLTKVLAHKAKNQCLKHCQATVIAGQIIT
jgi:hypothetical protein